MTDVNKKAFEQAEKELMDGKIKEVKGYILETLEKIESKKKDKDKLDEELRVLKLDLEDLRNGKFEKIEERRSKSLVARGVSVHIPSLLNTVFTQGLCDTSLTNTYGSSILNWLDATSGTYTTTDKVFYL